MASEPTAGDRYRVSYRPGRAGFLSGAGRLAILGRLGRGLPGSVERSAEPAQVERLERSNLPARGRAVYIENAAGNVVWYKLVSSEHQADDLIDLIRKQVLTARLVDFEAWLAGQRSEQH